MKYLVLLVLAFSTTIHAVQPTYRLAHRFVLGGEGGWDYVTYDGDGDRLFIAHGSEVLVVAAADGKKLGSMPAEGVHGIALVPELHRGFYTNGRAGTVTVFDTQTLKTQREIRAGENPDAIIYDPESKRIIVMNGRSHDVMVIDPATEKVEHDIPLQGKLEFAALYRGRLYVNVEDMAEIRVVDAATWKAIDRWKLSGCEDPTGLAVDASHGHLFVACGNAKMTVLDANSGKEITSLPTGSGTDAAAFDSVRHRVLASNGQGTLTVIQQDAGGRYSVLAQVPTERGARTMALDPKSGRVFLITAERPAGQEVARPGALLVLVYELNGSH